MPGKANTYTLGEFGVNRVKSPIHLLDGELLTAQNAEVPFEKGNRGLRKRSGMSKLNPIAAAGAIHAMSLVPLPDPDGILHAFAGGVSYIVSDDGIAWFPRTYDFSASSILGFQNKLWYVSGGSLYSFDRQKSVAHCTLNGIDTGVALAADVTGTAIIVSGMINAFLNLFAVRYDILTDTRTVYAPPVAPSSTVALACLDGTAYVGSASTVIYRTPASGSLVAEFTIGSAVQALDMAVFGGKVYAACYPPGADPNTNKILRRDGVGSWTSVLDISGEFRYIAAGASRMYANRFATGVRNELWTSTDGASWSMESDLSTTPLALNLATDFHVWNDVLFITGGGGSSTGVYRRDPVTTVVSRVDTTPVTRLGFL